MISQEDLTKYEKQIEHFISLQKMDDEILMKAIVSCSELVYGYADNAKHFAKTGDLGSILDSLKEMKNSADRIETMINEANRRAENYGTRE